MTRGGAPRVEDVAAGASLVELWSSAGWVPARITAAGEGPLVRVRLSDGSALVCAPDTAWPVVPDARPPADSGTPRAEGPRHSPKTPPRQPAADALAAPAAASLSGSGPAGQSCLAAAEPTAEPARPPADIRGRAPSRTRSAARDPPKARAALAVPAASAAPGGASAGRADGSPRFGQLRHTTDSPRSGLGLSTEGPRTSSESGSEGGGPRHRLRAAWAPRPASALRAGDRVAPYPAIPAADLKPRSATAADAARDAGAKLGRRAAAHGASRPGLSDDVCGYAADALRAFVEGWSAAQQGCLVGCAAVIADLQVLLRRAGVDTTLAEPATHRVALYVDERCAWLAEPGSPAAGPLGFASEAAAPVRHKTVPTLPPGRPGPGAGARPEAPMTQSHPAPARRAVGQSCEPAPRGEAQRPAGGPAPARLRAWTRRLRVTHQTVVEVEFLRRADKAYAITVLAAGGPVAVAAGNTMLVAAREAGAPPSSCTKGR